VTSMAGLLGHHHVVASLALLALIRAYAVYRQLRGFSNVCS
jgi:hypothetical protein